MSVRFALPFSSFLFLSARLRNVSFAAFRSLLAFCAVLFGRFFSLRSFQDSVFLAGVSQGSFYPKSCLDRSSKLSAHQMPIRRSFGGFLHAMLSSHLKMSCIQQLLFQTLTLPALSST